MRLTIAYSKIKKRNLVLNNNDTHQRGTVSERPIRPPLSDNLRLTKGVVATPITFFFPGHSER